MIKYFHMQSMFFSVSLPPCKLIEVAGQQRTTCARHCLIFHFQILPKAFYTIGTGLIIWIDKMIGVVDRVMYIRRDNRQGTYFESNLYWVPNNMQAAVLCVAGNELLPKKIALWLTLFALCVLDSAIDIHQKRKWHFWLVSYA